MLGVLLYPSEDGSLTIKTMQKGNITLFLLPDVVRAISKESQYIDGEKYSNQASLLSESISALDEDERHIEQYIKNGVQKKEVFVTEPGIYRVISRAKSSGAKKFQRWIYHEVMPSIRKYGVYPAPKENDGEFLQQLADQQAKQSMLLSKHIRRTNQQFEEIDKKVDVYGKSIHELTDRVAKVETLTTETSEYYKVTDIIKSKNIDSSKLVIILAYCEKIVTENQFDYIRSKCGVREEQRFPMHVIEVALSMLD